jgi:DNA primase
VRDKWIVEGLKAPLPSYHKYLSARGVDSACEVSFHSWVPHDGVSCPKFQANFGRRGERLSEHLIATITSPRGEILGLEARKVLPNGDKKVNQYRTASSQWNPYILGAERAFKALWEGGDVWIVEGLFDKVALDKVIPQCDAVISTLRAGMDAITLEMLVNFYTPSSTFYVCYDNDETGRKKTLWLQSELKTRGCRAVIWNYRGKDPGEVWAQGGLPLLRRMFL